MILHGKKIYIQSRLWAYDTPNLDCNDLAQTSRCHIIQINILSSQHYLVWFLRYAPVPHSWTIFANFIFNCFLFPVSRCAAVADANAFELAPAHVMPPCFQPGDAMANWAKSFAVAMKLQPIWWKTHTHRHTHTDTHTQMSACFYFYFLIYIYTQYIIIYIYIFILIWRWEITKIDKGRDLRTCSARDNSW